MFKKILFSVLVLFQAHCTTMNKNYKSNYGRDTKNFCKSIFKDSKIKNLSDDKMKHQFNNCLLYSTMKNVDQERTNTWIQILTILYVLGIISSISSIAAISGK